jgi:hypothetical protein
VDGDFDDGSSKDDEDSMPGRVADNDNMDENDVNEPEMGVQN